MEQEESLSHNDFMLVAVITEGSLVAIAFVVGWFVEVNPVSQMSLDWWPLVVGTFAAVPMLLVLGILYWLRIPSLDRIREMLVDMLGPLLARCHWLDLIVLAFMAGLCEEILFRGTLQLWFSQWGLLTGFVVSAIAFGVVHAVTPTYLVLATLIGLYLSWSMTFVPQTNLLVPIVAHAVYDYIAFYMLIAEYRKKAAISKP